MSRRLARALANLELEPIAVAPELQGPLAEFLERLAESSIPPLALLDAWLGERVFAAPEPAKRLAEALALRTVARALFEVAEPAAGVPVPSWLVSLDLLPPHTHARVLAHPEQRAAWTALYGCGEPHPRALVDSRFFPDFDLAGPWDGLLVHGECVAALRCLELPPIDAVLIDPPYNTGNAHFPYRDDRPGARWADMMRRCLTEDRARLTRGGSVIVHIDEHEHLRLDQLLAEVFGRANVVGPIVWDKRNPKGDATGIAVQHEYLGWAVGDAAALRALGGLRRPKENAAKMLSKAEDLVRRLGIERARAAWREWVRNQPYSAGERAYRELDERGPYRPVSMAWPSKKPAPAEYFRPVLHPVTHQPCPVPARGWRNPPATMDALIARGEVLFGTDHTTQPTRRYRLADNLTERVPSLLYHGGSDDDLLADMGVSFPTPKPVRVAAYVCAIAVPPGGTVLDHFAGSGTTGHAILELNRQQASHRRFVLIESGDSFERVLVPRIARAAFSSQWRNGRPVAIDALSVRYQVVRL